MKTRTRLATPAVQLALGFLLLGSIGAASAETWSRPLKDGAKGSAWCVCRSVGTSPHIGQDWVKSGTKVAVAVQKGKITSLTFDASCGYMAIFTDVLGTKWRYVHLNKPTLATNTTVLRGVQIATISSYPKSACGTGPHLHFERRNGAYWNDSAQGKTCDSGFETCYWNPNKPAFANRVADEPSLESQKSDEASPVNYVDYAVPEPVGDTDSACKLDPRSYPIETDVTAKTEGQLQASVTSVVDPADGLKKLEVSAFLEGNAGNECGDAGKCLVDWTVLAEQKDGQWLRVFYDNAVRNHALARVAAEQFCEPADTTGRYLVRAVDMSGAVHSRVVSTQ